MKDDPVSSRTDMIAAFAFAPGKWRRTLYYQIMKGKFLKNSLKISDTYWMVLILIGGRKRCVCHHLWKWFFLDPSQSYNDRDKQKTRADRILHPQTMSFFLLHPSPEHLMRYLANRFGIVNVIRLSTATNPERPVPRANLQRSSDVSCFHSFNVDGINLILRLLKMAFQCGNPLYHSCWKISESWISIRPSCNTTVILAVIL